MITAALIVLLLVYSFFEKRELFTWPPKLDKGIMLLLLVLTSVFSYIKEHDSDCQHNRIEEKLTASKETIARLEGKSEEQIRLIDTLRYENRVDRDEDRQQRFKDHLTIINQLARYGLKLDDVSQKIVQVNTQEIQPTLDIMNAPKMIFSKNGKRSLRIKLESYTSNAHILKDYLVTLRKIGEKKSYDILYINTEETPQFNKSSIIPKYGEYSFTMEINDGIIRHLPFVFVYEVLYKSDKGLIQPPMIKAYQVLDSSVRDLDRQQYDRVYSSLQRNNLIIGDESKK